QHIRDGARRRSLRGACRQVREQARGRSDQGPTRKRRAVQAVGDALICRDSAMTGTVILETDRLILRELEPNDLDFLASMMADPDVSHHYDRRFSREAADEWLHRQLERYATDGHGLWLVTEKATGAPVGQVGLILQT